MIFTTTLSLILALAPSALLAAPTRTIEDASIRDVLKRGLSASTLRTLEDGVCDLGNYKMPIAPTPLPSPEPGLVLSHVAFGRGTQNYTCSAASAKETPTQVGAVAQLYNVTCTSVRAPTVLSDIPALALVHAIPDNDVSQRLISGHHQFTSDGVPLFVLNSNNNQYGYVAAGKNASSGPPSDCSKGTNGLGSVPWLRLLRKEGDYKEVYRIDTAGGVAPKTCDGINGAFQVEYSAIYYFWK